MSFERGRQAIQLQAPDLIPHTQYCSHPEYMSHITGLPLDHPDLGRKAMEVMDYDFVWNTDGPGTLRGRFSDMGRAYWNEGQRELDTRHQAFTPEEGLEIDCREEYGVPDRAELTRRYEESWQHARTQVYPFAVYPGGIYRTEISFMIAAFGWDTLLNMAALDLKGFTRVMDTWFEVVKEHYAAWAETSIDVFLCHDDMVWSEGPFINPAWYRGELFPRYRELWRIVKEKGKKLLFCSDGNYTMFVDDLAAAGADGFIFEPLTDLDYVVKHFGQSHVIIGNADCRVLTFGSVEETKAEVRRVMDTARDCPGFFFAVGNHLPANIPMANIIACLDTYRALRER